jgi:hypothetical protein
MRLHDKLLPCLLYAVRAGVYCALAGMLLLYILKVGFWLLPFGPKSLPWVTFDIVFNFGKVGLIVGFICGIDTWIRDQKGRQIQAPKQRRRG